MNPHDGFLHWLRSRLPAGLLVIVPVFVTLWLTSFFYIKMTEWAVQAVHLLAPSAAPVFWVEQSIRIITLLAIIIMLALTGEFAHYKLGRYLIRIAEWIMLKLPLLGTIYSTTRQIGEALWTPQGGMFRKVVLIEYPRKGIYAVGFVTRESKQDKEVASKAGRDLISVFLPTTPNPTSGFLLFVPRDDCIFLQMKVADGMRLVISGGAVTIQKDEVTVPPPEIKPEENNSINT